MEVGEASIGGGVGSWRSWRHGQWVGGRWLMLDNLSVSPLSSSSSSFFFNFKFGIRLDGLSFLVGLGPGLICSWRGGGPKAQT